MKHQTISNAAAQERDRVDAPPPESLSGWEEAQKSLAAASGLSLLLVNGHQPPALLVANNNSICQAFQSSPEYVRLCDPYCGEAHARALKAGTVTHYRCHAGLHCFTMPVEVGGGRKLAVIGGRAFLTTADYRALAERFRVGDLQDLLSSDLFRNVIFAAQQDLADLAKRISGSVPKLEQDAPAETVTATAAGSIAPRSPKSSPPTVDEAATRIATIQSNDTPPGIALTDACGPAIQAFVERNGLVSVALLLPHKTALAPTFVTGRFKTSPLRIEIETRDARLTPAAKAGTSLPLRESPEGFAPVDIGMRQGKESVEKIAELFPLVVGEDVKGALLIGDENLDQERRKSISKFCRDLALPLEVLRLRDELEQRTRFTDYLQGFTERINAVEPAETYRSILRYSAELLRAERGSLLLLDEASNELEVKAAIGMRAEVARETRIHLGESISGAVLREGRPLVVRNLEAAGYAPAPAERHYKTKSFISYPIIIAGRKVGVLNVTDKAGGGTYDEADLSLLAIIAPQMALALDRAEWQEKAAQFQLMSITDPLTGLLNRRYLEERLTEELNRSKRYHYAMSFMMIDIDDFKIYNDNNGHQAGDMALEMTAQCLKSALRSADVAARYGGEEFCILLPQTPLGEAKIIAERIRRRVERARYKHGKTQPLGAVTISIGLSAFAPTLETPVAIIGAADRALYLAKKHGKNCVQAPDDPQPETFTGNVAEDT